MSPPDTNLSFSALPTNAENFKIAEDSDAAIGDVIDIPRPFPSRSPGKHLTTTTLKTPGRLPPDDFDPLPETRQHSVRITGRRSFLESPALCLRFLPHRSKRAVGCVQTNLKSLQGGAA
jgi:hypothetical protein